MTQCHCEPIPLSLVERLRAREITIHEAMALLLPNGRDINTELIDDSLGKRFCNALGKPPEAYGLIPLLLYQATFYLGASRQLSEEVETMLSLKLGTKIHLTPISESNYRQWQREQHRDLRQIQTAIAQNFYDRSSGDNALEITRQELERTRDREECLKTLFHGALLSRASDIHLEPIAEGLQIRFRIDGVLQRLDYQLSAENGRALVNACKVLANLDIADSRRPQDGRISEKMAGEFVSQSMDMRVSSLPSVRGEKIVIRMLPQNPIFYDFEDLGLSSEVAKIYQQAIEQPQGAIVLTGPTGSGKTSTLYTTINRLSSVHNNIITIEDPVEYLVSGITQIQVNEPAGLTFANGLRAALRQDPDVIMVGEIRDSETADTAIRAAITGHLVLTTLHTNDAIGAIPRLIDIGCQPGLLADALQGILAQRLVRKICPHCFTPYQPSKDEIQALDLTDDEVDKGTWNKGLGCNLCANTGYLGRVALVELLRVDERIRAAIGKGNLPDIHKELHSANHTSFRKAALDKVLSGQSTIAEIRRVLPVSTLQRSLD